jgi:hypothetical protein
MLENARCMTFRKNCTFAQFADSALTFSVKIVPFSGLFMDDLPRPSNLESLLGATVCFHFRHIVFLIKFSKQI